MLATSMTGCSAGSHDAPSKSPIPAHLVLPAASGTVLPVIGQAFKVQGVEAGLGISMPGYFSPPPDTTNVYLLLEVNATFTEGARATPGPMIGLFGFNAPECSDGDHNTSCDHATNPLIGGELFLTKAEAINNPGAFFKPPAHSPTPPQLKAGIPYYTLVAESIPTNIPLKDVTFCSDEKCLPLAKLPKGTL